MELLIESPRKLEQLRVPVNEWIDKTGGRALILSRQPRSAFPIGDGSSLVIDSTDIHLKSSRFAEWAIADLESRNNCKIPDAQQSRGFTQKLHEHEGRLTKRDVYKVAATVACQTLYELGPNYIAWLEEWVIEYHTTEVPIHDVPEWMQGELISAGVGRLDLDHRHLILFDRALGKSWLDGLQAASKLCTAPPMGWRELSAALFELERTIRRSLAFAFEAKLGTKWHGQVLRRELIEYIRKSANFSADFNIGRLSNPLDYLTLGQLIDLAAERSEASHIGFDADLLQELRRVTRIRNRVVHMRLPKPDDLKATRTCLRQVKIALQQHERER
ncbi:hypothetical protein [Kutzneria sp. NPDC051319]|uniref:hypothetical protein n=1 Tax=Kutzneria sp. NPDC051319 TaxID=3155047 RepID=UPI00344954C8